MSRQARDEHEKAKYQEGFTSGKAVCTMNWGRAFYNAIEDLGVKTILDVGCGSGAFCLDMVTIFEATHAYGIDVASVSLDLVPKNHPDLTFFDGSATKLPLQDDAVEWVASFDVLEHIQPEDVDQVLDEITRVSTKGLLLTISHRLSNEIVNGENLHATVQPLSWWQAKLESRGWNVTPLGESAIKGSGKDSKLVCKRA
tara:strand:+ start:5786 stop:6382 length:597 start_codon:yes stop_codon:yes gene_type:complete